MIRFFFTETDALQSAPRTPSFAVRDHKELTRIVQEGRIEGRALSPSELALMRALLEKRVTEGGDVDILTNGVFYRVKPIPSGPSTLEDAAKPTS